MLKLNDEDATKIAIHYNQKELERLVNEIIQIRILQALVTFVCFGLGILAAVNNIDLEGIILLMFFILRIVFLLSYALISLSDEQVFLARQLGCQIKKLQSNKEVGLKPIEIAQDGSLEVKEAHQ